jgi:hypothetical protein
MFVDCVVDDLPHQVVQTAAVMHIADVHAWPLANCFQALEDLNGTCSVLRRHTGYENLCEVVSGGLPALRAPDARDVEGALLCGAQSDVVKPREGLISSGQRYLFALLHATMKPTSDVHSDAIFRRFFAFCRAQFQAVRQRSAAR